ncbi:MAG: hypothetical protein WBX25_22220 [Rhodomicrobium sp.]
MSDAVAALVAELENAARDAQQAEAALRKQMAREIERLERQRAFAFRRTAFVHLLASRAASCETENEAHAAQREALAEELGWHAPSEAHEAIFGEMKPLGRCIWQRVRGMELEPDTALATELDKFEAWFEEKHGSPFYSLFEQYVPEAPLVDF